MLEAKAKGRITSGIAGGFFALKHNKKRALTVEVTIRALTKKSGGVLLSHTVPHAVPSTLRSLTSVFEMGTGVTSLPLPPENRSDPGLLNRSITIELFVLQRPKDPKLVYNLVVVISNSIDI